VFYLPRKNDPHYPTWSGPLVLGLAIAAVTAVANSLWLDWGGWLWLVGGLVFLSLAAMMRSGAATRKQ